MLKPIWLIPFLLVWAVLISPFSACAFDVRSATTGPPIYIKATEINLQDKKSSWHGRYGLGFVLVPEFAGARAHALDLDLDLKLFWKNTFFFENGTAGVIALKNRIWRAGFLVRGVQGRRQSRLPATFAGLGKVDTRLDGGVFAGLSFYKTYMSVEYFTDISGVTNGQTLNLEAGYTMELSRQARLVPYVRLKWGSARHLQAFFGVNAAQATSTSLLPFQASAGVYERSIGAIFENDLGRNWRLGGSADLALLGGAARISPLTQSTYGSREQFTMRIKLLKTF